eukprot:8468237-Alexandrium_andersonii.AAC.1
MARAERQGRAAATKAAYCTPRRATAQGARRPRNRAERAEHAAHPLRAPRRRAAAAPRRQP